MSVHPETYSYTRQKLEEANRDWPSQSYGLRTYLVDACRPLFMLHAYPETRWANSEDAALFHSLIAKVTAADGRPDLSIDRMSDDELGWVATTITGLAERYARLDMEAKRPAGAAGRGRQTQGGRYDFTHAGRRFHVAWSPRPDDAWDLALRAEDGTHHGSMIVDEAVATSTPGVALPILARFYAASAIEGIPALRGS